MADNLQPDLPQRSPQADAAVSNRDGIVVPPDVEDATSALDKQFEEAFGRTPSQLDNTPDRDREKAKPAEGEEAEPEFASEVPEDDTAIDPDGARAAKEADQKAKADADKAAADEAAKTAAKPTEGDKKDFLDDLLGKQAAKPDEKPAEPKPEEDPYKDHKLRADASDRTKSTFEDLKRTAREREAQARAEAEKFKKEAEEARRAAEEAKKLAEESAKKGVPEDVEKELKELREFRATVDVEHNPEFNKKFDERRERNNSTIFETLQRNGLKPEVIEQVKKLTYDQQLAQIDAWAEKLPTRDKLTVRNRLADNENVDADRAAALSEAKAKAAEVLAKGKANPQQDQEVFVREAVETLKPLLPQLPWLHPKEVPANAAPAEKQSIEQHNQQAVEAQRALLGFLQDNSPRSRSLLALAGVLAPRYRAEAQAAKAKIEALEKELNSIKEAGRLSKTARSSGTAAAAGPRIDQYDTSADDAMDRMAREMGVA